jgi:hypothetical protein
LSEDPIGFASGDFNWCRYVWNSPVNLKDPDDYFGMVGGTLSGAGAGFAVGIFDAIWNTNCITEGLQIIAFDTATGAILGFLASGGGWLGVILGESGGIGLNIISVLTLLFHQRALATLNQRINCANKV